MLKLWRCVCFPTLICWFRSLSLVGEQFAANQHLPSPSAFETKWSLELQDTCPTSKLILVGLSTLFQNRQCTIYHCTALVVIGDIMGMGIAITVMLKWTTPYHWECQERKNAWLAPSMILSSMTVNYGKICPSFWLGKIKGLQIIGPETFISK